MDLVNNFFSSSLSIVDNVIGHFVQEAYTHLIAGNKEIITLLFTFYVMLIGYQFLHHHHHFNINEVIKNLITMLCVYALIMNWQLYHLFVYNIFTNEPAQITGILSGASGKAINLAQTLDALFKTTIELTLKLLSEITFSISSVAFLVYAGCVFTIGCALCVVALVLFIYAKMMLAVLLAIGPIFIIFLLWNSTKNLFSSWFSQLITLALIPIITTAILMLMLSVIQITLPGLDKTPDGIEFINIAPFLALGTATILVLKHVFKIASALGSGITLDKISLPPKRSTQQQSPSRFQSTSKTAFKRAKNV